jgi:GT2 family glycosyltransferase
MKAAQPLVTVIVINWNRHQDTLACLASLRALTYSNYEVVVIDNGSSRDDLEGLRQGLVNEALVENRANTGFVGGNNQGLAMAKTHRAEFVLLLNNDTLVAPDLLTNLVEVIESEASIAAVGPTILYESDPDVIWSAGGSIDWRRGLASMLQDGSPAANLAGQPARDVDFLTGCALMVRRSVIDQVGRLEPRFFAYYEETEWCVRMARAGYRMVHVPMGKVWHKVPRAKPSISPLVHYYMTRNRLLFLRLTGAGPTAWLYTLLLDDLRTLISWAIKPKWRNLRQHRTMMVRALLDFFRGEFGECQVASGQG